MPITEIVRTIARAPGRDTAGRNIEVELRVDTDGRFGQDADATGFPAFWIVAGERVLGPFTHEDEAVEAAEARFGATFD